MKAILSIVAAAYAAHSLAGTVEPATWVDPFIGTSATAHCFPNACRPFGMVQAGPTTGSGDWQHCSGYRFEDKMIYGFVQDALSGTGCPDLGDIRLQPFSGEGENSAKTALKGSEKASAGYYSVEYPNQAIKCEMTATPHVGVYRFTFNANASPRILLDFGWGHCQPGHMQAHVASCETQSPDTQTITGHLHLQEWVERDFFFAIKFSRQAVFSRDGTECVAAFADGVGTVEVKVALSRTSVTAALANLRAEANGWDFDGIVSAARDDWNRFLSKILIDGTPEQKTAFYTAMYHLGIAPNTVSDSGERPFYSTFSFWDTFRALHPLYTIITPEKIPDMIDSILSQGRKTGYLPIWTLMGEENQCMIGTHSIPVLADAFFKGFPGDWQSAYAQIKDTLTVSHAGRIKENWDVYDRYCYYPFDLIRGESVSRTLECCYDDWCAGKMAQALGKNDDANFFFARARRWRNVFDATIGFVRGKDSNGNWREPFNPFALGHGADTENDFTEGNAFQYTWHVLHEPETLVELMGGKVKFAAALDSLFAQPEKVDGMGEISDVTGLIGQYAHGNEQSHHVAYLYRFANRPDRTAEVVREVCERFYRNSPDGLSGNDDCGQMSAWYVFACLGFYPVNPCGGDYVLGAPQVPYAMIALPGGKHFSVRAPGLSKDCKYVKSITLNGKRIEGFVVRHTDIMRGGELVFEMSPSP